MDFRNYLNSTIPLVSKEKNIIIYGKNQRFDKILFIEKGLVVAFLASGDENRIYYLWKSFETVVIPYSFFKPYIDTGYIIQTLQPTRFWVVDHTHWKDLKRYFKRDVRRLRHAMHANFIRRQEELQRLRHMSDAEKYQWYEANCGTNLLKNQDAAMFLGIKPRTFDRIKNGK